VGAKQFADFHCRNVRNRYSIGIGKHVKLAAARTHFLHVRFEFADQCVVGCETLPACLRLPMRAAHGSSEVGLTVFGKLMRDLAPALPLTLRDVDGYLLKENTDPDRALMPCI
jgi:hypothetical protein